MPLTQEQQIRFQLDCFGCTEEQLKKANHLGGPDLLFAMGILSDAQELLELGGDKNKIRQYINRAKFFMSEELEKNIKERRKQ